MNKKKILDCLAKAKFMAECVGSRTLLDMLKPQHGSDAIKAAEEFIAKMEAIMAETDA